jgi:hypothetical protein
LKIIAVTPAGRRIYLQLLSAHILADSSIDEWHLWDNCRLPEDRVYIRDLAARFPDKVRIVERTRSNGSLRSINRFYDDCTREDAFYLKIDDDVVWLSPGFAGRLCARATAERGSHIWWSVMVINNAICSWLLERRGNLRSNVRLSAQASDRNGWANPYYAAALLELFADALADNEAGRFGVPDVHLMCSRFSINCIGFFGSDVRAQGEAFCPPGEDDEEWISAVWPMITDRPGRIIGDLLACHFAFNVQEPHLTRLGLIDRFYDLAGIRRDVALPTLASPPLLARLRHLLRHRRAGYRKDVEISLR